LTRKKIKTNIGLLFLLLETIGKDLMKNLEKLSEKLTVWVGTPASIVTHTILFISIFSLRFIGVSNDDILLILTTAVSLEAIYLAIFIQMTINKNRESLAGVEKDIDDIQENVEDLTDDVKEISDDYIEDDEDEDKIVVSIEEIRASLEKLSKDITKLHQVK